MTSVNVTEVANTVTLTEDSAVVVVPVPETTVVVATTLGPQGPPGPQCPQGASGIPVDIIGTVDKSVVYYDAASSAFRADSIWTTTTLSDGGNF